jgi:hypothetical protein
MRRPLTPFVLALALAGLPLVGVGAQVAQAAPPSGSRDIPSSGSGGFQTVAQGTGAFQPPEFPSPFGPEAAGVTPGPPLAPGSASPVNRSLSSPSDQGEEVSSAAVARAGEATAAATLGVSFHGLDHFDQRTANGGNQFSLEPPDQGLCVGNGFIMETVNDVIQVFDTSGNPVTDVVDQNTFYGYAPAINRATGKSGPFVTDPSCHYDADVNRWFHVVLTLETKKATGDFTGKNHLDLAVSDSPDPTGTWTIYRIPVQDDGTQGTPDHHCPLRNNGSGHGPCIGDYPHMGADANGFYLTTNEYAFFPDNIFHAAQIYAFSKQALASTPKNIKMQQFDTLGEGFNGQPGFTVWPAIAPQGSSSPANGGSEFFLSSDAGEEASGVPGGSTSNRILVWSLTGTSTLSQANPDLDLERTIVQVGRYSVPPASEQNPGPTPLRQCINDTERKTPAGKGCWRLLFTEEPAHDEVLSPLDSNDSRMQQVWYADGKLFGALDTGVKIRGDSLAGIDWFVIDPAASTVVSTGFLASANLNVTYPAIATNAAGSGVMAFTLVGENDFPSAAYATIDATGVGPIQIAAAGIGPQDGFSGYKAFGDPPRPRWGDYGAAQFDGTDLWIASEYIGQTCTLGQWLNDPIGLCGGTRSALANWGTRISQVIP